MFACYQCSTTCISRRELMKHLTWKHGVLTNIPCVICNCFLFRTPKSFNEHLRTKHLDGNIFGPFLPPNSIYVAPEPGNEPRPELELAIEPGPEPRPGLELAIEPGPEHIHGPEPGIMDVDFDESLIALSDEDEDIVEEPDDLPNPEFDTLFRPYLDSCFEKWLEFVNHPDATVKSADLLCSMLMDHGKASFLLNQPFNQPGIHLESMTRHRLLPFTSEYRRRRYLEEQNLYSKPEEIVTSIEPQIVTTSIGTVSRERKNLVAVISIEKTLLNILSIESISNSLVMPSSFAHSPTLCHPFAGRRAQNLVNENGEDCLLLELYMDEFVTTNPIGNTSVVYKMAAWYFRLLNLPLDMLSQLDHILLASLAHSVDVMDDLQEILRLTLLPQLKKLETDGITFQYRGMEKTFKVVLYRLAADNLGFHQLVGLTRCFSGNNPCWMCTETAETLRTVWTLNPRKLRTRQQYDHLTAAGTPQQRLQYGIAAPCCLNELQYFHCMENFSADYMHDLHEGHFLRFLPRIFRDVITAGYSLNDINNAIASFGNVGFDGYNPLRPIYLPAHAPDNGDTLGGYTAKTSGTLVRFLPLIFKCAKIRLQTPSWQVFMKLQRILDILYAPEITPATLDLFDTLVQSYLKDYIAMGGKMTVKPHKLLHYKSVMEEMGPLRHLATFRYEGKHSRLKQYSNVNRCFKNLQTTLADKNELMFASVLLKMKDSNYLESRRKSRNLSKFKKHLGVVYGQDVVTREPKFGEIYNYDATNDLLSLKLLVLEEFDESTHCYVVRTTENVIEVLPQSLVCPEPVSIYRKSRNFIRMPYFLP